MSTLQNPPARRLSYDDLLALANQHLLRVVPGRITSVGVMNNTIVVESVLDSVFAGKTPSEWRTSLSREDGDVLECVVTKQSVIDEREDHWRDEGR